MVGNAGSENRGSSNRTAKSANDSTSVKSKRRRWRLLVALAVLLVVVWLLPSIVAETPLFSWILKTATADLNGSVTVRSASLGWFSPIAVEGVEVKDAVGKTLLTLPSATGDRSLLKILCNYTNLGTFRLANPDVSLLLRDDGTNVEDALSKYLSSTEKSTTQFTLAIEVVDGCATVTDQRTGLAWQVKKIAVKFGMSADAGGTTAVEVSANLPDAQLPGGAGSLAAGVKMDSASKEITATVKEFPLAMLRAVASRFVTGATLTGRLSSEVRVAWSSQTTEKNAPNKNAAQINLNLSGFSLGAPSLLQSDVLRLDRLTVAGQASWQPEAMVIENSTLDCDFGRATLAGTLPLGGKDGFSVNSLLRERQEFSGQIDLAKLAQMLPATLHLRPQMQINSGAMQWAASSRPAKDNAVWHAQVETANLTATNNGRQIVWQKPLSAVLDAHEESGGAPVIDKLRCESDFLVVQAAGNADALNATLAFSLQRLADQLGQFVDFGGLQFAGEGSGKLDWRRSPQRQFDAGANIEIRGFQWAMPNQLPWREESVILFASAKGVTNFDAATRIDAATLTVKSGADQIDARLLSPVEGIHADTSWPVGVSMQGQLQNWPARLAAWLPANEWKLAGGYGLEAQLAASTSAVELRGLRFAAAPLVVNTPWLNVNETRVDAAAAGSWDQAKRRLQVQSASLTCPTVAVEANNVVASMPAVGSTELSGTLKYQADAGRLSQCLNDPKTPATFRMAGQLQGAAQLQQTAGVVRGNTTAELVNLIVIDSSGQQFQEPKVQLLAEGDYDTKTKTLLLSRCELQSSALAANAAGRLAPVTEQYNAQLDGKLSYDLERLTALLRPWLGPNIGMTGRGSSSAWYRGPFSLAAGSAAVDFRSSGGSIYGFPLGAADVKASMANGAAQIEPLDLPVSGGKVHLAPRVRLTPSPMELTLPKGPLVERVRVDPAMCATLLKFIAPSLSGASGVQGTFSIDLDTCRIPFKNAKMKSEVTGRFTVHSMSIASSPMLQTLSVFQNRASAAELRRESVVPFQVAKGRVSHSKLELVFPDITIRTRGSVGLEQPYSLDIVAEMPVPSKWTAGNTTLAQAMRNQTIAVPLRGTLAKPALDEKVMQNYTRQFLQKAAGNVIEGELNRLFTPKK